MRDKRIAILESRLGPQMVDLVVKRGGVAVHAPALAEVPDVDPAHVAALVSDLEARPARIAIFQTGVGTRALFQTTDTLGLTDRLLSMLDRAVVVARGPKPTAVLRARNVRIDRGARDPFTTHEVLETLEATPLAGVRVIVQRYGAANVELEHALTERGAEIVDIPTYRWALPDDTAPLVALIDALERREIDAVAFTNAAQVHNLFDVAGRLGRTDALRTALKSTLIASVGPVTSDALREFEIDATVEASPPKLGPLVSALDEALSR
jgi:uroporphyrinogen-III synthase